VKETVEQENKLFTAGAVSKTNSPAGQIDASQLPSTPYIQTKLLVDPQEDSVVSEGRESNAPTTNFLEHKSTSNKFGMPGIVHVASQNPIIQRQPGSTRQTPAPAVSSQIRFRPEGVISRQEFDQYVQTYFGVSDVHTGTQSEQEQRLTRHGVPTPTIPNWQSWDPGAASEDYTSIIDGVEEMLQALGAMPQVRTIIFFQSQYEADPNTGVGIPRPSTGASFGAGELTIYESFTGSTRPATGRSLTSPAGRRLPDRSADITYNIIHELGHGVGEAASNNSRQMFDQFNAAVGWLGTPPVLYDIGQADVQTALANSTALPSQHIISPSRWNDVNVMEQPMSYYAVGGGSGEDFAESIAAYIQNPMVLEQRSPRRHQFIRAHIGSWTSMMRNTMPGMSRQPKGDFNLPSGDTAYA